MALTQFPLETTEPKIEVTLPVGRHVLELIVEDSAGLRSAPTTVVITVQKAEEVSISIDPPSIQLSSGGTQQFTAKVGGTTNTGVTWSIQEGNAGGKITQDGLYTAPATSGSYHVIASSVADPGKSAAAAVTVKAISLCTGATPKCTSGLPLSPVCTGATPLTVCTGATPTIKCLAGQPGAALEVSVSVTPDIVTLQTGKEQQFTATVTGSDNTAVTWKAETGSIDASGLYKATTPGSDKVTATSKTDPAKSATATVTVKSTTLCVGATPKVLVCTGATPQVLECTGATPKLELCTGSLPNVLKPMPTETPTRSVEKTAVTTKKTEEPTIKPKSTPKTKPTK